MHVIIFFVVAGFVLLAIREICLIVYRLYFHPLARIPGPKLAAATQLYEFYYDILKWPGGQYWLEVDKMHERYGKFLRCLNANACYHYGKNIAPIQIDLLCRPSSEFPVQSISRRFANQC